MQQKTIHLAFQVFALEIYRLDPDLFQTAMATANAHVEAAMRELLTFELTNEKNEINGLYQLTGLMTLLKVTDPADLPDLDLPKM